MKRAPHLATINLNRVVTSRMGNLKNKFKGCNMGQIITAAPRLLEMEVELVNERFRMLQRDLPLSDEQFKNMLVRQPKILENRYEKTTRVKMYWIKKFAHEWEVETALREYPVLLKLGWTKLGRLKFFLENAEQLEKYFDDLK